MSQDELIDLVIRLREGRTNGSHLRWAVTDVHQEAADEIERLRMLIAAARREGAEEMRKAIVKIMVPYCDHPRYSHEEIGCEIATILALKFPEQGS